VAENCLLAQPIEGLLTRKLPLKLDESAAIYDPKQTPYYASNHRPMVRLAISAGLVVLTHLGEIYPVWVMLVSIYVCIN
jgi:hypothetical protein